MAADGAPVTNIFSRLSADEIQQLTPEQREMRKAHFQDLMYERTGGFVVKPNSQKGKIVYVNAQNRAKEIWMTENIEYFIKQTKFDIRLEKGTFKFPAPELKGELNIFIIDEEVYPGLMVVPEERWASVNVRKLVDDTNPKFFEMRVKKELTRAFAILSGAMNSSYPGNCVGPITKTKDLDQYPDAFLAVDVIKRFNNYVSKFGIKPAILAPYSQAVKEGWAATPTNDIQKTIWLKIHDEKERGPSNAIKIEPPKK